EGGSSGQGSLTKENSFPVKDIRRIEAERRSLPLEVTVSGDSQIHIDFMDGAENWCKLAAGSSKLSVEERKSYKEPSGRVRVSLPAAWRGKLDLECVSGAVKMNGIQATSVDLEAVSGTVTIEGCSVGTLDLESVSGSVRAEGAFNRISVETVSGSVKLVCTEPPTEKCRFESVSGSVNLSLPHTAGYTLTYKSMSGSFSDGITGTSGGNKGTSCNGDGSVPISVSTMSGSIKVE
ncbi:MAG: DUF4097 family beta strand repeat protein, partial [Treponema sp.]|nr:DUF4097 family beta strand repeat protein [Treponema sp.]